MKNRTECRNCAAPASKLREATLMDSFEGILTCQVCGEQQSSLINTREDKDRLVGELDLVEDDLANTKEQISDTIGLLWDLNKKREELEERVSSIQYDIDNMDMT